MSASGTLRRRESEGRFRLPPTYGILLLQLGTTGPVLEPPEWVIDFDPDGGDPDVDYPTGHLETHEHPRMARRFPTMIAAMDFVKQQSTRTPFRPDGQPNRPLTAFTTEIKRLPDPDSMEDYL